MTDKLRQAAQQALGAVEAVLEFRKTGNGRPPEQTCMGVPEALRDALAEQAEQEPVAHLYRDHNGELRLNCITPVPYFAFPVYTAPQPAIDAALVRAQALKEAWDAVNKTPGAEVRCDCMNGWATVKACADAIVALKEKT